ncbi:MAG: DUF4255 domain-containing protein [Ignavibacteriae bacterium]|nr:MAG: DUF4255 domain-containing protein [Ignavibacteriota bacterium]
MIEEAFQFIRKEINNYFNQKINSSIEERIILGDIAKVVNDGELNNKIILSLVNVEEDRISRNPDNYVKIDDKVIYKNPGVNLNLYCLFTVNREKDYAGALKHLSLIIQFFQYKNVFTHDNSPVLNPGIEKLVFDLYNLNFEKLNHLWSALGGKYLPSVLYKLKMITIDEGVIDAEAEPIKEIDISGKDFTL